MGVFKAYKWDDEKGCIVVSTKHNTVTQAGRRYILDRMFDTGTHGWNETRVGFLGIGTSTDNDGVVGPTDVTTVSVGGDWHDATTTNWELAHFVAMGTGVVSRTGDSVKVRTRLTNTQFAGEWATYGTGSVPIVEEGLFLGSTQPTSNPINTTSLEDHAMVAWA
jgi:hypothetical protein